MGDAIMIIMLAAAGIMMIFFKAKPAEAVKGSIMNGGVVAVISILGVSWMGSSFFEGNRIEIVGGISGLIQQAPWVLATWFICSFNAFIQSGSNSCNLNAGCSCTRNAVVDIDCSLSCS